MSVYSQKGKGWRYDFTRQGTRYTEAWFKTKAAARKAEAEKREELEHPQMGVETQTGMGFLELVNRRLDHVKAYNSDKYYLNKSYYAKTWVKRWGDLPVSQVTPEMVENFILERSKVSCHAANMDIRYLRAMFNFAKKRKLLQLNPTDGMDFLPTTKTVKFVPSPKDIDLVISEADSDTQDYLWAIRDTMARVGEINKLTWQDVDLQNRSITLYTRKKKGGHLTPRKVPMTGKLFEIMLKRHKVRDASKPWIFWQTYWSTKAGRMVEGPFQDRKKIMLTLCRKAGVKYFRFHALRHSGASVMESENVPIGSIQRILGHESRTTTEIYLHSIGQSERAAMDIFESARGKSHTKSHTGY